MGTIFRKIFVGTHAHTPSNNVECVTSFDSMVTRAVFGTVFYLVSRRFDIRASLSHRASLHFSIGKFSESRVV